MKETGQPGGEPKFSNETGSEFREFHRQCKDCGQAFVVNVPRHWFLENGTLNAKRLPDGITPAIVEKIMAKDNCGACTNKEKYIQINGKEKNQD